MTPIHEMGDSGVEPPDLFGFDINSALDDVLENGNQPEMQMQTQQQQLIESMPIESMDQG